MKKLQILLLLPFLFMACQDEESTDPVVKNNSKSGPSIVISSATGIVECVNGVKEYGAEFTVDQTTWDYYYDGGGGSSFDKLSIKICTDSDCNNPVGNGNGTDLKSCKNSRFDRTTIIDIPTPSCAKSSLPDCDANTTYYLQLFKGSTESNIVAFTTPSAGSTSCSQN